MSALLRRLLAWKERGGRGAAGGSCRVRGVNGKPLIQTTKPPIWLQATLFLLMLSERPRPGVGNEPFGDSLLLETSSWMAYSIIGVIPFFLIPTSQQLINLLVMTGVTGAPFITAGSTEVVGTSKYAD